MKQNELRDGIAALGPFTITFQFYAIGADGAHYTKSVRLKFTYIFT